MAEKLKNGILVIVGWGLVGIGIIGLVLPFLQGVLLIALGLFILSQKNERIRERIEKFRKKFSPLDKALNFFGGKT